MDKDVLDALCNLALAKVTHPLNQEIADDHLSAASKSAFNVGLKGLPLPESFKGKEQHPLLDNYKKGEEQLDVNYEFAKVCWSGAWTSSSCGRYETIAVVERTATGFCAGLYSSHLGADPGAATNPQPEAKTLDEAIKQAQELESSWHSSHDNEEAAIGSAPQP